MVMPALIVDSDSNNRHNLGRLMKMAGFEPVLANSGSAACRIFASEFFDTAIINTNVSDMPADQIARRLRRRMEAENFGPATRIICIIYHEKEKAAFPPHLIDGFLLAPFSAGQFQAIVGGKTLKRGDDRHTGRGSFDAVITDEDSLR